MSSYSIFLKTLFADLKNFLRYPTRTTTEILGRKVAISRALLIFIIFTNSYFLFLPSFLLLLNIIIFFIFFISLGSLYYFSQEMSISYEEETGVDLEDRFFYVIAYCFALAGFIGFLLNFFANLLFISLNKFLVVGVFWATLSTMPIAIIYFFYCLKVTSVLCPNSNPVSKYMEQISQSFIVTCKEGLGFKAVSEMLIDWRELK
jgi:hypothetical protein